MINNKQQSQQQQQSSDDDDKNELLIDQYIHTVNRKLLDFDFEKTCCVTLSNVNVYLCLVCGKYYQGRSLNTPACIHAINDDHHIFLNVSTGALYILPDQIPVSIKKNSGGEASEVLNDVICNLNPRYLSLDQVNQFDCPSSHYHSRHSENDDDDKNSEKSEIVNMSEKRVDINGQVFYPGYLGLNNLKNTDTINVVIQSLSHVTLIRNYFLLLDWSAVTSSSSLSASSPQMMVVNRFGELVRKIWNGRTFKGHVSPHELLQAISIASEKKFGIGLERDPIEFLTWFLNLLHMSLSSTTATKSNDTSVSVVAATGSSGSSQQVTGGTLSKAGTTNLKRKKSSEDRPTKKRRIGDHEQKTSIISETFQGMIRVTQETVSIQNKGDKEEDVTKKQQKKKTTRDVPFIYLTLDIPPAPLFKDEQERNIIPQIPIYQLLNKYNGKTETIQAISNNLLEKKTYSITKLPKYLIVHMKRFSANNFFHEKNPTIVSFPVQGLDLAYCCACPEGSNTKYDLVANICHEGDAKSGFFKVHILHRPTGKWLEMQDLDVKEIIPQIVSVSEAYIQIYEQQKE